MLVFKAMVIEKVQHWRHELHQGNFNRLIKLFGKSSKPSLNTRKFPHQLSQRLSLREFIWGPLSSTVFGSSSKTDETVFIRFCTAVRWHAAVIHLRRTEENLSHESATAILVQIHKQAWNSVEHIWLKWDSGVKLLTSEIHHSQNSLIIINEKKKKDVDWNANVWEIFQRGEKKNQWTTYLFIYEFCKLFPTAIIFLRQQGEEVL